MNIDKDKLRAMAEAFPEDLDFDSNDVPFSLHPEHGVVGGESDGTYSVFGKPFRLEGEDYDYDGPTYVEQCSKEFAQFMVSAREGVLALLGEIERLEADAASMRGSLKAQGKDLTTAVRACSKAVRERDQLKAENEALRKAMHNIMEQVDGNIRETVRDCVNGRDDVQDIYGYCDTIEGLVAAAMAKEKGHD